MKKKGERERSFLNRDAFLSFPVPINFDQRTSLVAIWTTCKLCKYKKLDYKAFGVKTKISHCASWSGCVKHVENVHYLHDPKYVEESLTNPRAHWNNLEDRKARLRGVETLLQGQSMLDECVE